MSMYMGVCLSSYYGCVPYESVSDIVCQICVYNLCICLFMCAHFLYVSVQCISVCIDCIACTCVWAYLVFMGVYLMSVCLMSVRYVCTFVYVSVYVCAHFLYVSV